MSTETNNEKKTKSDSSSSHYDYDLIVIGGGSGGLAAAKEAKKVKPDLRVAVFDYVSPSPHGTKWGLGGTCVNVGCIPKKLMHYAGSMHHSFADAHGLGWNFAEPKHDWPKMVQAINNYIRSLNFSFKNQLKANGIEYINAAATFVDAHTVTYKIKDQDHRISAATFIVAVGGRPTYPNIPGANLGISSDDIFWTKTPPGKTLIVGASYIALECAGFLHELGFDVTVMVRSRLLRGFDEQCAAQIGEIMERDGIRFINPAVPEKLERKDDKGPIQVSYVNTSDNSKHTEEFDTVMFAIGRTPNTAHLGLEKTGLDYKVNTPYIAVNDVEQTNVSHIYAVGDVIAGQGTKRPELTPVAIQAGVFLARRLYAKDTKKMDYNLIPTAVFTPIEYGACGMSQEHAETELGKDNVEVFVSRYNTLEAATTEHAYKAPRSTAFIDNNLWARHNAKRHNVEWKGDFVAGSYEHEDLALQYNHNKCLAKLVCDKRHNNRVVGFHYLGPNAGEICQGFALAMRYGATKEGFDDLVGIHPTSAEEFTVLSTKPTDNFMKKEGCGGGGSCG